MKQYTDVVIDERSLSPIEGAEIFVYDEDGKLSTLYAADGTTTVANPVKTNGLGVYSFYQQEAEYTGDVYVGSRLRYRSRLFVGGGYSGAAQAAAAAAQAAAGSPPFASTAAGLAGTEIGQTFWVDNGDGTGTTYRHDAGPVATEIGKFVKDQTAPGAAPLLAGGVPTSSDLASTDTDKGAALVAFKDDGDGAVPRTIRAQVAEIHTSVTAYGALGDDDTDDGPALQAAIDKAGVGGTVFFPRTDTNVYRTAQALKFYPGQTWRGVGGQGILLPVTKILLTAAVDDAMVMPETLATVTEGLHIEGILFDDDGYADRTIWFYNTMYSAIERCGVVNRKTDGAAVQIDADDTLKGYFNRLDQVRAYAVGENGTAVHFTRGANSNQMIGGAARDSYIGIKMDTLSSGNTIIAVDMEENDYRHFYVDAPSNNFIGNRMENAPVGFEITANAQNTYTANQQWARSCVIPFIDNGALGTRLENMRPGDNSDPGMLRFGAARFDSSYSGGGTTLSYDPLLGGGSANALINFFRNTTTTGTKQVNLYRGDGTSQISVRFDLASGDMTRANAAAGQTRLRQLRPSPPSTCVAGDICEIQSPTIGVAGAYIGVASNTWALLGQAGVAKGATGSRPTLAARDAGARYFDTDLAAAGKPIFWTGTAWVDATGTAV